MKLEVPLRFLSDIQVLLRNANKTVSLGEDRDLIDLEGREQYALTAISQLIGESAKLILPINGRLLPDEDDRHMYAKYMKMPFPSMTFVFRDEGIDPDHKDVIVVLFCFASIDSDIIYVYPLVTLLGSNNKSNKTNMTNGFIMMKPNENAKKGEAPFSGDAIHLPDCEDIFNKDEFVDYHFYKTNIAHRAAIVLTDVLLAFNIERGVRYEDLPVTPEVSHKLNNKRAKRGKAPLYQYRILDLNADRIVYNKDRTTVHTHASPRAHMRRAHIRHLENKAVWVRECMVNAGVWEHVDNPIYVGRKAHG